MLDLKPHIIGMDSQDYYFIQLQKYKNMKGLWDREPSCCLVNLVLRCEINNIATIVFIINLVLDCAQWPFSLGKWVYKIVNDAFVSKIIQRVKA